MKKEGKDSGLAAVLSGLNEKKNPKPEKAEKEKLENPEAEVKTAQLYLKRKLHQMHKKRKKRENRKKTR